MITRGYAVDPDLLKEARLAARMTPSQLAENIGVSRGFIYHLENGRRRASFDTVCALENVLKRSPSQLGVPEIPAARTRRRHRPQATPEPRTDQEETS